MIPQNVIDSLQTEKITELDIDRIKANPYQPRKKFDKEKLESLSLSIKKDGILQPVVVRRAGEDYELIMGERRLQAARMAGLSTIPAIFKDAEDADALRLALVENLQRENLNPLEIADAYKILMDSFGLSTGELASFMGKGSSTVSNTMRLLGLPNEVKELIRQGRLTEGHARAVLALPDPEEQKLFAARIVNTKMNVRVAETEAGLGKHARRHETEKIKKPAHISYLENAISKHLGTRVTIDEKRGGKGKMTIEFYSHDDFERLAETLHIPLPR